MPNYTLCIDTSAGTTVAVLQGGETRSEIHFDENMKHAERIGDASVVILANHGAIVTAPTIEEATYKSATLDRQCKLMYDVLVTGRSATVVPPIIRPAMKASLLERGTEVYWAGAVRRLLRRVCP